jgi:hypothetical protein
MIEGRRSLAKWMDRDLGERELARQWSAIEARHTSRRSWRWVRFAAGGGLAFAGAGLVLLLVSRSIEGPSDVGASGSSARAGAVLESGGSALSFRLDDGSALELQPGSRLEGAEAPAAGELRFRLQHGRATFDVVRNPQRRFVVDAGAVRVTVLGTRFSVERTTDRIEVGVERGLVEVETDSGLLRLAAGEIWSSQSSANIAAPPVLPSAAREAEEAEPTRTPAVADSEDQQAASAESDRREHRHAIELFENARAARQEGRDEDAANLYQLLLRQHPRDSRAGLAAFELARIRMDALDDPRGAIEPLERTIRARVGPTFHEDAMARLVRAYDASGQQARCRDARQQYLRTYPEGLHVTSIERSCRSE